MACCNICVSDYNKSTQKPVTCHHCKFDACLACAKRFLVESNNDPACMNCKKLWSYDFLVQAFPNVFLNDALKKHRENQLFERELSLLPSTQPLVEVHLKINHIKAKIIKMRQERNATLHERNRLTKEFPRIFRKEKKALDDKVSQLESSIKLSQTKLFRLEYRKTQPDEKREFVRHCPVDNCRGFLSTQWKCGICRTYACSKCHEIIGESKDAPHECKPENLETAKMLAKDSKPCPGCSAMIFKISGCNQMWCSNCGVAFDWKTLRIDRGHLHNPEYFKALANNKLPFANRQNVDLCGVNPPADYQLISHVNSFTYRLPKSDPQSRLSAIIIEYFQRVRHIDMITRIDYGRNIMEGNADLRVKYMLKEIDIDKFKKLLQQREKSNRKNTDILQVINMVIEISTGLFHDILAIKTIQDLEQKKDELHQLLTYGDECMQKIAKNYKTAAVPVLLAF